MTQRKQATVVVLDMRGSTPLSAEVFLSSRPDDLKSLVELLKSWLASKEKSFGFRRYKFLGDGWILLFGKDCDCKRLEEFISAVCGVYRKFYDVTVGRHSIVKRPVGLTFGVDEGELVRLSFGATSEFIGWPIIRASRLQGAVKEGRNIGVNSALVAPGRFSDYLLSARRNLVRKVTRNLRGIPGGEAFRCFRFDIRVPESDLSTEDVELARALEDRGGQSQIAKRLVSYYGAKGADASDLTLFVKGKVTYPILVSKKWIPVEQAQLALSDVLEVQEEPWNSVHFKEGRNLLRVLKFLERQYRNDPAYAAVEIKEIDQTGTLKIVARTAAYRDFIMTSQVLDAELRLAMASAKTSGARMRLPIRDRTTALDLSSRMTKIGLNVLTAQRTGLGYRFFVMDRSRMKEGRPIEYPNAIHVVPAGTVQHSKDLNATLHHEFVEEFFGEAKAAQGVLQKMLERKHAQFFFTAIGIDALTLKLEICGLLVLDQQIVLLDEIISKEGQIRPVDRKRLESYARQRNRILPAGALAIWRGLECLDALTH